MSDRKLVFYFDIESPYSHIALELLCRHRPRWRIPVELKPVVLGAIFKAVGNNAPGHIPVKGAYAFMDMKRSAQVSGVPFNGLPSNSLASPGAAPPHLKGLPGLRALTFTLAAYGQNDPRYLAYIRAFFDHLMIQRRGKQALLTTDVVTSLARHAGFSSSEAEKIVIGSESDDTKSSLRSMTQEAIERGAFGAPYIYVEGSTVPDEHRRWFGSDRFEMLAAALELPYLGYKPTPSKL